MHKTWLTLAFENISLLNLIALTSVTFYMTEEKESQEIVAYISIGITFVTFIVILACLLYMQEIYYQMSLHVTC